MKEDEGVQASSFWEWPGPKQRRRFGQAMVEAYYRSRRRDRSPISSAAAVALGVIVGCLPVYGFHLLLCIGGARLLRVSAPLAYLAAHVNNPWTAPFLLYFELGLGRLLLEGEWIRLSPSALRDAGGLAIGRDLMVGSLALGVGLAALLAPIVLWVAARSRTTPVLARLVDKTSRRYATMGIRIWETVRGKLRFDPAYLEILRVGDLRAGAHVVDLGCGRGILLAAIRTAQEMDRQGHWPTEETPIPADLELSGIEVDRSAYKAARRALGGEASIIRADLRTADLPPSDVIVCLDVLHYLSPAEQESLIARCASSIRSGGTLFVREAATEKGLRSWMTRWQERASSWARGEWRRTLSYRSEGGWKNLLERHGFEASSDPMWSGTPFSNILIRAVRSSPTETSVDRRV